MPLKTTQDEMPSVNLTPMIDIVFLLIIFFMVGTKFTELERHMGVDLPQVSNVRALTAAPEKKVVNVFPDGRITLDREEVSREQLTQQLRVACREYPDLGVIVRGDARASMQQAVTVMEACNEAGISKLKISVQPAYHAR
jgi:biopolymer transport protein ExbD